MIDTDNSLKLWTLCYCFVSNKFAFFRLFYANTATSAKVSVLVSTRVDQEESEQDEVGGTKKGADFTNRLGDAYMSQLKQQSPCVRR